MNQQQIQQSNKKNTQTDPQANILRDATNIAPLDERSGRTNICNNEEVNISNEKTQINCTFTHPEEPGVAHRTQATTLKNAHPEEKQSFVSKGHQEEALFSALQAKATLIRNHIIDMTTPAKSSHTGCALSIADILAVLYHCFIDSSLIKQQSLYRDYLILSKGHACSALYAALAVEGLIPTEELKTYYQDGSLLLGHPVRNNFPGIEASTGSLGHGLPMGVGLALAAKHDQRKSHVYVILGDGECQEGTIWESVILATRFQLDNLTMIIDYNNLQGLNLTDDLVPGGYTEKFRGFGCPPLAINGHNHQELITALEAPHLLKMPKVIIARTCKGKGIQFIENKLEWHYKSFNPEQYALAKKDLS